MKKLIGGHSGFVYFRWLPVPGTKKVPLCLLEMDSILPYENMHVIIV